MTPRTHYPIEPFHDAWLRPLIGALTVVSLLAIVSTSCVGPGGMRDRGRLVTPACRSLGTSVQGRPIEYITFGLDADCILIMATIHGDEDAGTPLVNRLAAFLAERPDYVRTRRVVLIPVANPDGYAAQQRTNVRGVDLNRNFPAENFNDHGNHGARPLSEPESIGLHALIDRERPRRIISIHQPLNYGDACIDYDGPAEKLAQAMAKHTDIPVMRIGSRPGSLGSYAGETLGIPIITLELPKEAKGRSERDLWRDYGEMLLAAIRYPEE